MHFYPRILTVAICTVAAACQNSYANDLFQYDLLKLSGILWGDIDAGICERVAGRRAEPGPSSLKKEDAISDAEDHHIENKNGYVKILLNRNVLAQLNARSSTQIRNKIRYVDALRSFAPWPHASKQIASLVKGAAGYGIDPDPAAAVAQSEGRFDRVGNCPNGARCPTQLMPDTARKFGVFDVCGPTHNDDGGPRYRRILTDRFKNSITAAAALNAGEQADPDHQGVPPYPETISYLADILSYQLGSAEPTLPQSKTRHFHSRRGSSIRRRRRPWCGVQRRARWRCDAILVKRT